jgi:V-ATPase subunit C
LHQTATECFQELFSALMHLKIIRVYIDGVLRFGIPPNFYVGLVIPKKGEERKILQIMSDHLADAEFKDMYGEKIDASEADDYWPFVNVSLTSPNFLHVHSR